jgi:hypothetical protein
MEVFNVSITAERTKELVEQFGKEAGPGAALRRLPFLLSALTI